MSYSNVVLHYFCVKICSAHFILKKKNNNFDVGTAYLWLVTGILCFRKKTLYILLLFAIRVTINGTNFIPRKNRVFLYLDNFIIFAPYSRTHCLNELEPSYLHLGDLFTFYQSSIHCGSYNNRVCEGRDQPSI